MSNTASTYRDFGQQVLAAADIVEVVGQYVELRRAGANLKGLCPFHQEKTPSFNVHPAKQIFKCFGCGKGGDAITFVREIERADYREALLILARKYGLEVPSFEAHGPSEEQVRWRQTLGETMEHAARYYQGLLAHPKLGAATRAYLERRGLRPETIARFGLGLVGEEWDGLAKYLEGQGYSQRAMIETGLARERKSGPGVYDYLRNRLIFPIANARGSVIAFGGRIFEGDEPKYLNTAETTLFQKGRELYGLYQARDTLTRQSKPAVLVEGYMDVIACHQAGLTSAVASMGTSLTSDQARLIRRYSDEAVFLYDADEAGIKAILRGLEILVAAGLKVRVGRMLPGEDPDSLARERGPEALARVIDEAAPFFDFMLDEARKRYDLESPESSVHALEIFEPVLSAIDERLVYDAYVQKLAIALGHSESALRQFLAAHRSRRPAAAPPRAAKPLEAPANGAGPPIVAPPDFDEPALYDEDGVAIADDAIGMPIAKTSKQEPLVGVAAPTRREKGLLRILIDHGDARVVARERLDPAWIANPLVRYWVERLLALDPAIAEAWPELMRLSGEEREHREFLEAIVFSTDEPLGSDYMTVLEQMIALIGSDHHLARNRRLNLRIAQAAAAKNEKEIEALSAEQMRNLGYRIEQRREAARVAAAPRD